MQSLSHSMTISFNPEAKFEKKLHRIDNTTANVWCFSPHIPNLATSTNEHPQNEKFPRIN